VARQRSSDFTVKGHALWRKGGRIDLELLPKPKGGRGAIFPASNIDLSFRSRGGITFRVWPLCVTNLGFLTPSLFSDATRSSCLSDKRHEGSGKYRAREIMPSRSAYGLKRIGTLRRRYWHMSDPCRSNRAERTLSRSGTRCFCTWTRRKSCRTKE
jgi:hypothetical protein